MFIGIDLGTSSVKTILTDQAGTLLRSVTKEYPLLFPQAGWSEQDPDEWFKQTLACLKELVKGYESEIEGLSFSGQMHGLVLLDSRDRIIRNALLWNDQRTILEVEYLNETIGYEKLLDYTGNIALTGLTAPKLLWVKNNEPDHFHRISKIMLPKDYLIYKLSGAFASDVSDLSGTLYFDPKSRTYAKEMLQILEIHEEQLPSVHESIEVVGSLLPDLKKFLGLKNEVLVIAGGGDQAVGAVGVGILEKGECSISLGTSGVIFVASDQFVVDNQSYLQSYAHANGKYHIMAVMLNAAGAIKWWNESILDTKDYDKYYEDLKKTSIEDHLFFLPYLTGERAPINDPYAKGVLYGMGIQHTKAHLDRAVVEGVTFALKDSFTLIQNLGVPLNRIRITGGGAKSKVWAQMIADIMNKEVVRIQIEEGPALGAAILAMVGCGTYKDVKSATDAIIKLKDTFIPNKSRVLLYETKYKEFQTLYPTLKTLFKQY